MTYYCAEMIDIHRLDLTAHGKFLREMRYLMRQICQ